MRQACRASRGAIGCAKAEDVAAVNVMGKRLTDMIGRLIG
jgi:hypothetical protein